MPHPTFQKLIDDLETAVSAWENDHCGTDDDERHRCGIELDFYRDLRSALDTYYVEVAGR